MKLSEELKAVKEKGFSKSHWLEIVIEKAEALETELIEERASYESQIQRMKSCQNCNYAVYSKSIEDLVTKPVTCIKCKDLSNWQLKRSEDNDS